MLFNCRKPYLLDWLELGGFRQLETKTINNTYVTLNLLDTNIQTNIIMTSLIEEFKQKYF